jgi:diguanylate cyclase (GGDEF)-like protein
MKTSLRHSFRPKGAAAMPPGKGCVLIVEDQRALSEMLAQMVKAAWDCTVLIAATRLEARALLDQHGDEIFAAVCDANLPDAPYGEVIELIAARHIPAIALTGTITSDIRSMMTQGLIVDYVLKKGLPSFEYAVQWLSRLIRNAGLKVLVADDSRSSLEVIQRMLSMQGLNVQVAHDGREALAILKAQPDIKLALVDYNMPVVNGFEFVTEARRMLGKERLAIIGISGEGHSDTSARFLKHGANDFMSKPYSFEEMTCRVNQNLEMLELVERMHHLANVDALTGLHNRRHFFEQGEARHGRAKVAANPVVVAMLDIDHFKSINDKFGHAIGDIVIRFVADYLRKHFPDALVARIGGEEFALFTEDHKVDDLRPRLDAFRELLPLNSAVGMPPEIKVTISIGVHGGHDDTLNALLHVADQRLYEAKAQGRNRVVG